MTRRNLIASAILTLALAGGLIAHSGGTNGSHRAPTPGNHPAQTHSACPPGGGLGQSYAQIKACIDQMEAANRYENRRREERLTEQAHAQETYEREQGEE